MGAVLMLLVLGAWVAVGAWWVMSHREGPTDAIGSFSRQLGTLQQRTPARFGPARAARPIPSYGGMRASAAYQRAQQQRRRRDILSGLALLSALTLVFGFVPQLHLLWALHVTSDVVLGGYVVALMRIQQMASERDMQMRFARSAGRPTPVAEVRAPRPARRTTEDDYGYELAPAFARRG